MYSITKLEANLQWLNFTLLAIHKTRKEVNISTTVQAARKYDMFSFINSEKQVVSKSWRSPKLKYPQLRHTYTIHNKLSHNTCNFYPATRVARWSHLKNQIGYRDVECIKAEWGERIPLLSQLKHWARTNTILVHFIPEKQPPMVYRILLNVAKCCVTELLQWR